MKKIKMLLLAIVTLLVASGAWAKQAKCGADYFVNKTTLEQDYKAKKPNAEAQVNVLMGQVNTKTHQLETSRQEYTQLLTEKIKKDDFLELHRDKQHLLEERIGDLKSFQSLVETLTLNCKSCETAEEIEEDLLSQIPEEYHKAIQEIVEKIFNYLAGLEEQTEVALEEAVKQSAKDEIKEKEIELDKTHRAMDALRIEIGQLLSQLSYVEKLRDDHEVELATLQEQLKQSQAYLKKIIKDYSDRLINIESAYNSCLLFNGQLIP